MEKHLKKQEINNILIASLIGGFIFGFDDKNQTFQLIVWFSNFILQTLMCFIFLILFAKITKLYSIRHGVTTKYKIWKNKIKIIKTIHSGIIFPIFFSFLTKGNLFFSAILSPSFKTDKKTRQKKQFKFKTPSEKELATISAIAPLSLAVIATLLSAFKTFLPQNISLIPFSISISTMLPLPKLNGMYVYFGSPTFYTFSITFIISSFFLVKILNPIQTIFLSILLAGILMIIYHLKELVQ
tara:strand:+ start:423 stop:1145 length:723 start_codon:yes stop_codon:yes gene_type:complete